MLSSKYWRSLIERLKTGDVRAFDEIYNAYCDKLYAFSFGLLKDPQSAQEMVQEVFVTLWEKKHQINTDMNFENYLITITHNSIKKVFRRRLTELKAREKLTSEYNPSENSLEKDIIYNELLVIANRSVEKLPPKRKQVYKMRRQEGLRIKEIAEKLNISKRTVECHLAKAIRFLKDEMHHANLLEYGSEHRDSD